MANSAGSGILSGQLTDRSAGSIVGEDCVSCPVRPRIYQLIIDSMREGLWVLDQNGITTFVNEPMARMLGHEQAAMINRPLFDFMDESGKLMASQYFERRRQGISEDHEFRFLHRNGEPVWTYLSTRALFDESGQFQGTLATIEDMTEKRRLELKRRENETSLSLFLNQLPATAWSIDMNYVLQRSYGGGLKTFGLSENELAGKNLSVFLETLPPATSEQILKLHQQALAGESARLEWRYGDRSILNQLEPIRGTNDEIVGAIGISFDMTEQYQARDRLAKSESWLRNILDTAPDAILNVDETGLVVSANHAAEILFDRTTDEIVNRVRLDELIREAFDTAEREPRGGPAGARSGNLSTWEALRTDGLSIHHWVAIQKDGRQIPVEFSFGQMDEQPVHTVILRDVSHIRELQKQLVTIAEDQQRRIGQELHDDVGQEMTGATMLAEALASDLKKIPEAAAVLPLVERLRERVIHGLGVVRGLARGLVLSVRDGDALFGELENLAANVHLLYGVEAEWLPLARPLRLDPVKATQLYRLAQEAVTNALRHSGARRIKIAVNEGPGGSYSLHVMDNGCGIPAESDFRQSRGMGLRIMKYRAGLIGGRLDIQVRPEGGTEVVCQFTERGNDD